MAKLFILVTICTLLVATSLSFPAISGNDDTKVVNQGHQALLAMSEDRNPEFVVAGENMGRADLSKITSLFNFTAYLEGRTPNATQISFVPLITILSNLNKG